ncbi:MAG TPA: group I intron-associated PD-(D/E)XK endonuclease [Candidatus Baltobacteraceae bacterium]|nr:group I intron-associated PD-(D/E)XK endonuclease [Candidatus Baltobacteraceae bacterium]
MDTGVKRDTKRIGTISELRVALDLARAGYLVSFPVGENCRYDLVADNGEHLYRIQVKTGRLRKGVVVFNTVSSHSHRGGRYRMYTDEIDFFAIFCRDTDSTYLVPIAEMPVTQGMLRITKPLNNQTRKMRWAGQYLLFAGLGVGNGVPDAVAPLALIEPS